MREHKQKKSLGEVVRQAGEALDFPEQLLPGFCHVELWQNRQAIVDGVKGVLGYSENEVQLNLGTLVLTVKGAALSIRSYQAEQLSLSGTIAEVHYTT
ncbi:MAG: YabP/YqfC family sporulation protein [Oscillospiraceae bacterium]|nr:YabP/YqfC family sporulation protein [Oscillospiraceae bacterium]